MVIAMLIFKDENNRGLRLLPVNDAGYSGKPYHNFTEEY